MTIRNRTSARAVHYALFLVIAGAVAMGTLLAGCSGVGAPQPETQSPWAEAFAEAMATESAFVRSVLADGEVTAEEFGEAQSRVVQCLKDGGISANYRTDEWGQSLLTITGTLSEEQRDVELSCEEQWMGSIQSLYWGMLTNPQRLKPSDAVAACLVRRGLVDEGFSGKDWDEIMAPFTVVHGDGAPEPPPDDALSESPILAPALPGGKSVDDHEVVGCVMNPQVGVETSK